MDRIVNVLVMAQADRQAGGKAAFTCATKAKHQKKSLAMIDL